MSVLAGFAPQISATQPPHERSQFRAGNLTRPLRFVSRKGLGAKRHDAAIMPEGDERMRESRHAAMAILAGLVLCGALARAEAADPSAETIARGKALVEAGDCAGCHTLDP